MAVMVTLQQAIDHLNLPMDLGSPIDPKEADLQLKLDAAEAQVLRYVKDRQYWTNETAPDVQLAILVQCGELWRFRGDDQESPPRRDATPGALSTCAESLVYRWRRPVFA